MCQIVTELSFIESIRILPRSEILTAVNMKSTIFWNITPCSPLKVRRRFGESYRLHFQGQMNREKYQHERGWQAAVFTLVSYFAYSTLKMMIWYSETSAEFELNIRRYISEDGTLRRNITYFENPIQYKYFRPLFDIAKYRGRLRSVAFP
jgi:hypothetical protein